MKITIKNITLLLIFDYVFMWRITEKWGLKGPGEVATVLMDGSRDEFEKYIDLVQAAAEDQTAIAKIDRNDIGTFIMRLKHRNDIISAFNDVVVPPEDMPKPEAEGKQTPAIPLETK